MESFLLAFSKVVCFSLVNIEDSVLTSSKMSQYDVTKGNR